MTEEAAVYQTGSPRDQLDRIRAEVWEKSPAVNAERLASCFPSLRGKPGVSPFDYQAFDRWGSTASPAERAAVCFVLTVFSGAGRVGAEDVWRAGPFRLIQTQHMDDTARAVVADWVRDPVWL